MGEAVATSDEYFIKRKLYPNVDYYSGIMLRALGIPTSMFTVMFAMARTVGWVSQWNEMIGEGQLRIGRPRQLYAGSQQRDFPVQTQASVNFEDTETAVTKQPSMSREKSFSEDKAD